MIQETHDSTLTGHPGRELTYATMARRWFWPGMSSDIRRFCRNCEKCGANTVWRDHRQGLLKPLPIPDRKWSEISIDFIQDLLESNGYKHIMVIVDRLGKGIQIANLKRLDINYIARKFVKHYIPLHEFLALSHRIEAHNSSASSGRGYAMEAIYGVSPRDRWQYRACKPKNRGLFSEFRLRSAR